MPLNTVGTLTSGIIARIFGLLLSAKMRLNAFLFFGALDITQCLERMLHVWRNEM